MKATWVNLVPLKSLKDWHFQCFRPLSTMSHTVALIAALYVLHIITHYNVRRIASSFLVHGLIYVYPLLYPGYVRNNFKANTKRRLFIKRQEKITSGHTLLLIRKTSFYQSLNFITFPKIESEIFLVAQMCCTFFVHLACPNLHSIFNISMG